MGLLDDAHMSDNQFSTLALIFYVSYLALEFPHGYGMQRLPTAKYLGTMVCYAQRNAFLHPTDSRFIKRVGDTLGYVLLSS